MVTCPCMVFDITEIFHIYVDLCDMICLCFSADLISMTAAPFWLEKPSNLVLAPEENARLVCRSDGIPRPSIRWFINGDTIEGKQLT